MLKRDYDRCIVGVFIDLISAVGLGFLDTRHILSKVSSFILRKDLRMRWMSTKQVSATLWPMIDLTALYIVALKLRPRDANCHLNIGYTTQFCLLNRPKFRVN